MPADLEVLLTLSRSPEIFDDQKDLQLFSPLEAIEVFTDYPFKTWLSDSIPICTDGCGDFCVYKIGGPDHLKIFVVPERDLCWDSARKIAGNISELILDPKAPYLSLWG